LRYGAWIGGRHPMAGSVDRFKLYIEIPARYIRAAQSLLTPFLRSRPHLPERELQLRMLGLEPATGRMEFYYRVEDLSSAMLSHLLYPAGLRSRADELLNCVEEAYGYSLRAPGTRIPGGSVGFSYAVSPDTNRVMFTLFLYARLLWGGDARIRTRFCEWLESVGQDSLRYREMTASLSSRDIFQTYHSSIGFILTSDAPIPISLGVRPPPVQNQLDLLSLPSQNTPEQKYL